MTMVLRRSAGIAGVALAIFGLLICLAGAAGVWAVKNRALSASAAVFGAADDAFEFMASRLVLVKQRVDSSRERVDGVAARAQRLQAIEAEAEAEVRSEVESLRSMLDTLVNELHAAEGWLDSIEAVARVVNAAAESIAHSQAQAQTRAQSQAVETQVAGTGPPGGLRAAKVAEFANDLADAISRLDALREKLLEMRENRIVAREFARTCIATAADLDTRLSNLAGKIDDFGIRVSEARASSVAAGQGVRWWITFGAVVLTAALLWFAAAQACVLHRAWGMSRGPRA